MNRKKKQALKENKPISAKKRKYLELQKGKKEERIKKLSVVKAEESYDSDLVAENENSIGRFFRNRKRVEEK